MTGFITADRLALFAPQSAAASIAPGLDAAAGAWDIATPAEICHWLAHLHVESQGFTRLEENLNYSAQRLCQVWPKRFPTLAAAEPYAHNPSALANQVYGGRMGNTLPTDGWTFRGSSWIGLTGRSNFQAAGGWCGLDLVGNPDLARQADIASVIAAAFWKTHNLNAYADQDDLAGAAQHFAMLTPLELRLDAEETRIINGGETGLAARELELKRALQIFPVSS